MKSALIISILLWLSNDASAFENLTNVCVTCSCTQTKTQFILDCKNRDFAEVLATWPAHNTSLVATFSYNNITTLEELPFTDQTADVVFSHCGIKTIDNGAFRNVKNVEYIDLSHNLLTTEEIAPEKFKGPYNVTIYEPLVIKRLNLAYNQIHSLPYNMFEHMTDLIELNLEGNQLKVLDHPTRLALSVLHKLEILNLANNDLTELIDDAVANLTSLKKLNLANNDLDFVPDSLAVIGATLQVLVLDDNPILEFLEDDFTSLPVLRELSLNDLSRVTYIRPNTFAFLDGLKILRMSNNRKLNTIDVEAFSERQTLEELYLNNNSLIELDAKLVNWGDLRVLEINNNPLICTCHLYNISTQLKGDIKRNKNGPVCLHMVSGISDQVYELSGSTCKSSYNPHHVTTIVRHFEIMRIVLIVCSALLTAAACLGIVIAFLRYRRYKMNLNYPFTTQVLYNPLNTSYIRS